MGSTFCKINGNSNSIYFWATHSRLAPMIEAAKVIARHLINVLTVNLLPLNLLPIACAYASFLTNSWLDQLGCMSLLRLVAPFFTY